MRSNCVHGEKTVISGGRVIDGTGNPWMYGDVVLTGNTIAAVLPPGSASHEPGVIDASGMVVCPGFIDIQSHSIMPFMSDRRSLSKITQGVTTEIMGEAWTPSPFGGRIEDPFRDTFPLMESDRERWLTLGKSWTRFGDWLRWLEREGVSVNVGSFVGDGTVREWGKGLAMGPADADEMQAMATMLAECMEDGAFGLATALIYPPGCYASDDELVELCRVVAKYHGVHITHMRSEESRILTALEQTLEIARGSGVATEIYHLKAAGRPNWRLMPEVIATINAARAAGIDVTADMYPYVAAGTGLASCLPPWAEEHGNLWRNLADDAIRQRIRDEMTTPSESFENLGASAGPENVILAGLRRPEHLPLRGKSLAHAAEVRGQHWADTALDLLAAEEQNVFCFYFDMSDDNLRLQMQQPWIKFSTDAGGVDPSQLRAGLLHPRGFGTYTRVLGHYVRELGTIPLEDAIRKMTSSVADRLSLRDRGLLRAGMKADVVIFDPQTVTDNATFESPHQLSTGVRDVWVNGVRVLESGEHTGEFPGAWVKGPGYRSA
ncbi:MAG: D-aminoacylase [Chloroflexia bacterium]|nr:D-aminoacylase [Chloroflexia bacterium]